MNVEFTDRYDGEPPSWLRSCHGECEATGWVPGDELDDPFSKCTACHGTGRVSWFVTVTRIPQWLRKGAQFMWAARHREMHPPDWGFRQRTWVLFKCAYLYDLKRIRV